jgi:alpha-galactosidase
MKQIFIMAALATLTACDKPTVEAGLWKATPAADGGVNVERGGEPIFEGIHASFRLEDGRFITTGDYDRPEVEITPADDGGGKTLTLIYTHEVMPTLTRTFTFFDDRDWFLTEFTLEDPAGVASNMMAPVNVDLAGGILGKGEGRALFVPYDNDCWVRYASHPLDFDGLRSYEVGAIFNNDTRRGIIAGSVEHDNWKTAVDLGESRGGRPGSLTVAAGAADSLTRDVKEHGYLRGTKIKSPKVFVGLFDDWRDGLEAYAEANAAIAPPKAWDGPVPFGWNSWGVLKFDLEADDAVEVADFFDEQLPGFADPAGGVVIGLDSGWNRFSEDELKAFVATCRANGQIPGIYWTPFTDWGKRGEREVEDAPGYKWKDVWLMANGRPQELDGAYALDPTHPAVEQRMKTIAGMFHRLGFGYVKTDFMTHGAFEADGWYNTDIQTGTQSYNYGMGLLTKYFDPMYINLSISPIFPAHHAQSRRIACDAWNLIKDTEYTMNALSYGWWIDRIYRFNDADHVVLQQATEGENRARVTSAVITGMFIAGDDFSAGGSDEGKERARRFMTNPEVNAIATGRSFRPVEGNGVRSESRFTRRAADGTVRYAVFNYSDRPTDETIPFERLGLDPAADYAVTELWGGALMADPGAGFTLPAKDVALFTITPK